MINTKKPIVAKSIFSACFLFMIMMNGQFDLHAHSLTSASILFDASESGLLVFDSGIFAVGKTKPYNFDNRIREVKKCTIPSPKAGVTDETKLKEGNHEMTHFEAMTAFVDFKKSEIWYDDANGVAKKYTIYENAEDPDLAEKRNGVVKGIQILIDKGIEIPRNLEVYLTNKYEPYRKPECVDASGELLKIPIVLGSSPNKCLCPLTIAFKRDRKFGPIAKIIISTVATTSPQALSGMKPKLGKYGILDKSTVTIIHEIGHILHERYAGELFWSEPMRKMVVGERRTEDPISDYSLKNNREFVAEVFTALILELPSLGHLKKEYLLARGPYSELFDQL